MRQMLRENMSFLIPWEVVTVVCIVTMAIVPRIEMHLLLNSCHTEGGDAFFNVVTELGGDIPLIVCGIMLIVKMWKGAMLLLEQVIATVIVTPLKHIFHHPRPLTVFTEAGIDFPIVEGVNLHSWNSFPSGHTAAVFALMFGIAVLLPKWWEKVICLIVALLVAYSRIYLSQHFLDDVVAGAVIGVVSVLLAGLFIKKENKSFEDGASPVSTKQKH